MSKEPVINTSAYKIGNGIALAIHKCDLMDLVANLHAGIARKKIQLAYYRERGMNTASELIEEQIRTGKEIYDVLEPMIEFPTKEETENILKNIYKKEDLY